MDPDLDADMFNARSIKPLDHRGSGSSLNGVDHHSIPNNSIAKPVDQSPSGGGMVSPHNNASSGSRVQDFPMLPPSTSEEMDSENAPASEHATAFSGNTCPSSTSNTAAYAYITPAAELSDTVADNFPLGVPMAEDKVIPSRRDYEAAFVLIGHPKTAKKIKNYRITSLPKPTRPVKSNSCQPTPPSAKDSLVCPPPTPHLSPIPEPREASPPVSRSSSPPLTDLPPTKISAENDLELIVEGFRKLKVSDSDPNFALQRSLDLSHSTSVSDDAKALDYLSFDSTQDQLLFHSEDLIQMSGVDPIHSTPVSSAVSAYRNSDSELWEELASLDGSFPLPKNQAAATALEFKDPIWTMKGVQYLPRGELLAEKVNSALEPSLSTDIRQSSFIKKNSQTLPDVLLSPLILEKDIDNTNSSAGVLFGKNFEFPSTRRSPSPSWVRGHRNRDLPPLTATKYSHKLPKHRSVKRPRSSEPLSSFIDYAPGTGFRTPSSFPSSCRVPRKHNSFEISRHGSFDESYTMPPALKNEPVVVRLVQDVQVKGVNVDSEPPLLKEGAIPEFLPVVEEPESNALGAEVNPVADRDNYPGLLIRILGMFLGYPCK